MPTHVIAGHVAAVLAPLAAVMALVYALVPTSRRGMRLPTLVAALGSAAVCLWAAMAGSSLYTQLTATVGQAAARAAAHGHAEDGDSLTIVAIALALSLGVGCWTWLAPDRRSGVLHWIAVGVVVACAAATLWLTVSAVAGGIASVWTHHLPLKG